MIDIQVFPVGALGTNAYVITDKETGKAAVIDPGVADKKLTEALDAIGEDNLEYVLLTHGHFDHIGGVSEYEQKYGPQIVISELDAPFLSDNSLNLSCKLYRGLTPVYADITLKDGDIVTLGNTKLKFMLTPGHTQGSGCFISEEDRVIFSGDTLFYRSVGRSDFVTSNPDDLLKSLKKLANLQGNYRVLPGHDMETSLEDERAYNPYLY